MMGLVRSGLFMCLTLGASRCKRILSRDTFELVFLTVVPPDGSPTAPLACCGPRLALSSGEPDLWRPAARLDSVMRLRQSVRAKSWHWA